MKLKYFIGENVRGYINFNVSFRDNLTFLIGINGSGKTTLLKLLSGLLTPSYSELNDIEFSEIRLICERLSDGKQFEISAYKKDKRMTLEYLDANLDKHFIDEIPIVENCLERQYYDRESGNFENINIILSQFKELNVVRQIQSLKTPLFLGLSRRISENNRAFAERDVFFSRRKFHNLEISDSVDEALRDIQEMVFENIRYNARKQSSYSDDFRKKVIQDSFKVYQEFPTLSTDYQKELKKLSLKKERLSTTLSELDIKDISDQLDLLFEQLSSILRKLSNIAATNEGKISNEYYETMLKWMINSTQLEKIDKITSYGNQYVENILKLKEPIIRFTESVNLFFKEGHKEILIDGQGQIKVKIIENNKTKINSIFELSSGEKQLIIMLAHVAFYKTNKKGNIFIVDEPELSLHISWQEIFVDALLKASPDTQFILATHAPAILARPERKEMCEDLSK